MNRNSQITVTTTPSLEGWEIQSYLGTITSHVVAGTNLFSDLFASLSDVFGGRSGTYQKQLSSINEEAITILRQKANELGSNCIVGLRIDHDEISGGGKSMFMVTAVGTAVKAKQLSNHQDDIPMKQQVVNSEDLAILLKKKQIAKAAGEGGFEMDVDTWNFITMNQIHELAPILLNELERIHKFQAVIEFPAQLIKYLLNLPEEMSKSILYDDLKNDANIFLLTKQVIEEGNLLDLKGVGKLLDTDEFNIQKHALSLLELDKPFYREQDIEELENLLSKIKSTFTIQATYSTEKSGFSSKEETMWICPACGKKNHSFSSYCVKCSKDIYGFTDKETNPAQIENLLSQKIEVLKEVFK